MHVLGSEEFSIAYFACSVGDSGSVMVLSFLMFRWFAVSIFIKDSLSYICVCCKVKQGKQMHCEGIYSDTAP